MRPSYIPATPQPGGRPSRPAIRGNSTPQSLEEAGLADHLADGSTLALDPKHMVLPLDTRHGALAMVPQLDAQGHVRWHCRAGDGLRSGALPKTCRGDAAPRRARGPAHPTEGQSAGFSGAQAVHARSKLG